MTKYNSKIGFGIVLFLIIVLGGISILMIYNKIWIGLAIVLLVMGFIGYIFITTYYLIIDKDLIIKSGFMVNKSVPIDSIWEISETNNPLSSPANSFDRLEIKYSRNETILISPKNKDGFSKQLVEINPKIKLLVKNNDLLNKVKRLNIEK
ncbi:MAG: PH domain-containing protein [Bacteroidetes bacterium]|nr:PH domain-containing protein [Bacteroidota bacterium]MBU1115106.1 PH domain-containing protein [Bacteroidota bacterium]MBU1800081.1 PH domain-containing protein [Bacteroidota bacterium]